MAGRRTSRVLTSSPQSGSKKTATRTQYNKYTYDNDNIHTTIQQLLHTRQHKISNNKHETN